MVERQSILLDDKEIDNLWEKWEKEDPYQITSWDEVLIKAQLREVVDFIDWLDDGTRSCASWRATTRKFREAVLKEIV